jgi:hypothetical protein
LPEKDDQSEKGCSLELEVIRRVEKRESREEITDSA